MVGEDAEPCGFRASDYPWRCPRRRVKRFVRPEMAETVRSRSGR
jgi:hypothetical protein